MFSPIQRRQNLPPDIYIRPHNFPLTVGLAAVCLAPNQTRMPVESFIVQANNGNGGICYIGDSPANAINGLELIAGQAWLFSVSSQQLPQGQTPTPSNFSRAGIDFPGIAGQTVYQRYVLNMADFYIIADAVTQLVKIFYTLPTVR